MVSKEVSEAVEDSFSKLLEAVECADNQYRDKSKKTKMEYVNNALKAWWVMQRAMRADLHGPGQPPKP